jgi:hypothetical protein
LVHLIEQDLVSRFASKLAIHSNVIWNYWNNASQGQVTVTYSHKIRPDFMIFWP